MGEPAKQSPVERLCDIIEEAGLRVTFDAERSIAKPCYFCGDDSSSPRELVRVASWAVDMGCWRRGDAVSRPICGSCCMWWLPRAMRAATDKGAERMVPLRAVREAVGPLVERYQAMISVRGTIIAAHPEGAPDEWRAVLELLDS